MFSKIFKSTLSIFTSALIISPFFSLNNICMKNTKAISEISSIEASNWAIERAYEKWNVDVDGYRGCQCVDLIFAYGSFLGIEMPNRNAKDFVSCSLPKGLTRVTEGTPMPGDIIVWDANTEMGLGSYCYGLGHIGIVVDVQYNEALHQVVYYTVETNFNTDGSGGPANIYKRTKYSCILRPDFSELKAPSRAELKLESDWFDMNDVAIFKPISDSATSYFISVSKDNVPVIEGTTYSIIGASSLDTSRLEKGDYTAYIKAINSKGYFDSDIVEFKIVDSPEYKSIDIEKNVYSLNEKVSVSVEPLYSKKQQIVIEDADSNQILKESCDTSFEIEADKLGVGEYNAFFCLSNNSQTITTEKIPFSIADSLLSIKGDINKDQKIDISDAVILQKWLLGSGELSDWKNADLQEDGIIDIFDMIKMRKLIAESLKK